MFRLAVAIRALFCSWVRARCSHNHSTAAIRGATRWPSWTVLNTFLPARPRYLPLQPTAAYLYMVRPLPARASSYGSIALETLWEGWGLPLNIINFGSLPMAAG